MGGPSDYLTPVAILYENQGIKIDDFEEKLLYVANKFTSNATEISLFKKMRKGYNIPYILNFPETEKYKQIRIRDFDKDFKDNKRCARFELKEDIIKIHHYSFQVLKEDIIRTVHPRSEFGIVYQKGDYLDRWDTPFNTKYDYQVTDVLETQKTIEQIGEDYFETNYTQKVKTRIVKTTEREEVFSNLEDALKKYPEYGPENKWNSNVKKGILFPDDNPEQNYIRKDRMNTFYWYIKEDKLYLDVEKMMRNISANSITRRWSKKNPFSNDEWEHKEKGKSMFSYTDLILTCEAIKTKNFKFLGYIGPRFIYDDLKYDNPNTLERYERALIDSETSRFAEKNNWTNNQLLRYRLENGFSNRFDEEYYENKSKYEKITAELKRKNKRRIKRLERRKRKQKKKTPKPEDLLPF